MPTYGVFSDTVFYRVTVMDAGLVRLENYLYIVEMSSIAVEFFVGLGVFSQS